MKSAIRGIVRAAELCVMYICENVIVYVAGNQELLFGQTCDKVEIE